MEKPKRDQSSWDEKEEEQLRKEYEEQDLPMYQIAKIHQRTYGAIERKKTKMGLRRRGTKFDGIVKPKLLWNMVKEAKEIERPKIDIELPNKLNKIVIFGDEHIPFQNKKAIGLLLEFLKDFQPTHVILIGDLLDFYEISKFRKAPFTATSLREEIEMAHRYLKTIREILPKSKIYLIEGNHERRWRNYLIDNAMALYDLVKLGFTKLLGLKELDITYFPCREGLTTFSHNYLKIGDFYIGHFDKSLKNACYTGRMLRDEFGVNIIQGHNHKQGISYRTYLDGTRFGAEVGCLCSLEPAYLNNPDWTNGFGILYIKKNKSSFQLINMKDNSFIFDGKIYK